MALDLASPRSWLTSHAQALGLFGQVLGHEPVSAPGSGLTFAVWLGSIGPTESSGLNSTSARVTFNGRVYLPADTEPMDDVDLVIGGAAAAVIGAYSGDFTLGGTVRNIDLLGEGEEALRAKFGYLQLGSTTYRVATLTIPTIVNSVWTQEA
ncbi:hypothetical protein [Streptomyces caniscabiei]|uniref:hypothetical protein n=1 Tax=Streptomyces caniscabiei TaxID=2746961 RepID=UPI00076593CD|nr:hypothetical protein [Streptomyces caniscabiei]